MKPEHEIVIKIKPGWFKQSLGIRFDMLCFFRLLEEFGIGLGDDVSAISKVPFDDMIATAIFTGAESYAFHHKQIMRYDKARILQLVDDSKITRGQLKDIGKLWLQFMATYTDNDKKKQDPEK